MLGCREGVDAFPLHLPRQYKIYGEGKGRLCRWCCNWVKGFLARDLVAEFVGITPWQCNSPYSLVVSCVGAVFYYRLQ